VSYKNKRNKEFFTPAGNNNFSSNNNRSKYSNLTSKLANNRYESMKKKWIPNRSQLTIKNGSSVLRSGLSSPPQEANFKKKVNPFKNL
jgi:hypothetical protein